MIEIRKYRDVRGRIPFDEWLDALKDEATRVRVLTRLDRLESGNPGDWKPVGDGVCELRIPVGKGLRIYYGWDGAAVVLLLCGGNKASQSRDIAQAKRFWRHYRGQ